MPLKNTNKEIYLHIPTTNIIGYIVRTHNFKGFNNPYVYYDNSEDKPDANGFLRHSANILAEKRYWLKLKTWRLAYFNVYTWKDEVTNKRIISEIHIQGIGLPVQFQDLVNRLEDYVGKGRVLLTFWGDEPYVLR